MLVTLLFLSPAFVLAHVLIKIILNFFKEKAPIDTTGTVIKTSRVSARAGGLDGRVG